MTKYRFQKNGHPKTSLNGLTPTCQTPVVRASIPLLYDISASYSICCVNDELMDDDTKSKYFGSDSVSLSVLISVSRSPNRCTYPIVIELKVILFSFEVFKKKISAFLIIVVFFALDTIF
jgi:hypothetical protein